jgi:hypothetical protein
MVVQEDQDLPDDFLLSPGVRDAFGSHRPDARYLSKPIRLSLDDVNTFSPKALTSFLA